jgi:hypothetical protein
MVSVFDYLNLPKYLIINTDTTDGHKPAVNHGVMLTGVTNNNKNSCILYYLFSWCLIVFREVL